MNNDLISREDLLKLIPPEEMVSRVAIMNAPTVNPYICSRCRYYFKLNQHEGICSSTPNPLIVKAEDFCSYFHVREELREEEIDNAPIVDITEVIEKGEKNESSN